MPRQAVTLNSTGSSVEFTTREATNTLVTRFSIPDGTTSTLDIYVDGTLRYKPGTWLKFEAARSKGPGNGAQTSIDGGFGFNTLSSGAIQSAGAERLEASVDLAEVTDSMKGKGTAYAQNRDRWMGRVDWLNAPQTAPAG